jgi:hypothetical protein
MTARGDQRRYMSKTRSRVSAAANAEIGLRKKEARAFQRALAEAKRTAGTRDAAAAVERAITGARRPFVILSPKPTRRRGLPKKRPQVIEKALGKHGSKGKKRGARKA